MISASRMGTPDAMSVPRVRAVRATVLFSMIFPRTGMRSESQSTTYAPRLNLRISFRVTTRAIGIVGSRYQKSTIQFEVVISSTVIDGSSRSNPSKIALNFGMIQIMMNVTMPVATRITATG